MPPPISAPPFSASIRKRLGEFNLIGRPGEAIMDEPQPGDVILRLVEGGAAHASVIASPGLLEYEELASRGIQPDRHSGGGFAHVVETIPLARPGADAFARQVTNAEGRLLDDLILVRLALPPTPTVIQVASSSNEAFLADTVEPTDYSDEVFAAEATISSGRLELSNTPLLATHRGTQPDLILRWNDMVDPSALDIVVHLHGYSGDRANMRLRTKEAYSGLDFVNPGTSNSSAGRRTPTLGILPRGSYAGDELGANPERYTFPALFGPTALRDLITYSLAQFQSTTGVAGTLSAGRLIVTAHSGGGAGLMRVLATNSPSEIYVFDALYSDASALISWVNARIAAEIQSWTSGKTRADGGLCILFRNGGTEAESLRVHRAIRTAVSRAPADTQAVLNSAYRVLRTNVAHGEIPRRFGWMLLADNTQTLPASAAPESITAFEIETVPGESAASAEALGPDQTQTDSFSAVEFLDLEEWLKLKHFTETFNASHQFQETELIDSAALASTAKAELATLKLFRSVSKPKPGELNYEFKFKARVYYPKGAKSSQVAGKRAFPVVLIVHGNHGWMDGSGSEINSHLGYEYLQKELAAHGIVSMSIDTNQANALDSLIRTRAEFIQAGLRIFKKLNGTQGNRFTNRLDLQNVGLMGHSRGGDAVVKAVALNRNDAGISIKAVCSLAPTDFTGFAVPSDRLALTDSDGLKYLVLYGSHDGDVSGEGGMTGFRHYDRATCDRTMAFVKGVKHDRFNTNWNNLPDYSDPADCSTSDPEFRTDVEHQQLAKDYIGGLFRLELNHERSLKGLFDGTVAPSGSHTISIQWSPPRTPRKAVVNLHGTPVESAVTWKKGWTTLMPFRIPGSRLPLELAYQASTGDVTIDTIDPEQGATTLWSDKWKKGWTHFTPFQLPGDDQTYDFAYMAATGDVAIDRIWRDGKGVDANIWKDKWSIGWTNFMPVQLPADPQPCLLSYKRDTGDASIDRIKPIGQGTENLYFGHWSKGWTSFVPFRLPGDNRQFYLAYKKDTGDVTIDRINADGRDVSTIWSDSWSKGWTVFVPFRVPGDDRPYYLAHKAGEGDITIDRIRRDGMGVDTVVTEKWTKHWTGFMTFEVDEKPHFLSYKVDAGDVSIGRLLPDKMLELDDFEGSDPNHNLLGGAVTATAASRVNFNAGSAGTATSIPHQTQVLKVTTAGAKYRADLPTANTNWSGFDGFSFRIAAEFKLGSPGAISSGTFPEFKLRIFYNKAGIAGSAEVTQAAVDTRGVRTIKRPVFREICPWVEVSPGRFAQAAPASQTKVTLQTAFIPLSKFASVNWRDVRSVEFEAGASMPVALFIDSLAIVQS